MPLLLKDELVNADEWHIEPGSRHNKLIVNGHFAGIMPRSSKKLTQTSGQRATINLRAQIRRILNLTHVTH
jgi:hypothetical protein